MLKIMQIHVVVEHFILELNLCFKAMCEMAFKRVYKIMLCQIV